MTVTKPRRELVWMHDIAGVQKIAIANPLDLHIEERFDQSEVLYFTVRADDPKAAYIAEDLLVRWRDRMFYVYETSDTHNAGGAFVEVTAPAIWTRLGDDSTVATFTLSDVTVIDGLTAIVAGSGWTAITSGTEPAGTFSLVATDASVLDLIRKWAKVTGSEVAFTTADKTVALAAQIGFDRGGGFRYGRNVTEVNRRANPPQVTRLYPFGKDDLTIAGLNAGVPYLEDFTFYTAQGLTIGEARTLYSRERVWSDTSYVTDVDLLAAAAAMLAKFAQPVLNYSMSVVDLSELTGITAEQYGLGDTVSVTDAVLGYDVTTRVVRVLRRPLEPARNEIELSYLPLPVPDPTVSGARTDSTEEWELFETRSPTPRQVRAGSTILGRIDLETVETAQWVVGFSLNGVGVGAGTIDLTILDDVTGDTLYPPITLTVTNGAPVTFNFTFGENDITAGQKAIVVRGHSSGAAVGADIAAFGASLWVLARGSTQQTVTLPNSTRFDYTGAVQHFTVPDDVTQITIDAHGSRGGANPGDAAAGGQVTATYAVTAGQVLDIYVGGDSSSSAGGWPNGGAGDTVAGGSAFGGGGSSHVIASGGIFANALIVAAGGGGQGQPFPTFEQRGGTGGFLAGGDAPTGTLGGNCPGHGATQSAGGAGGTGTLANGSAGTAGQGGAGGDQTAALGFPPGGGGGGWYGGGGGGANVAFGAGDGGGGGGGSGWAGSGAFDVDYNDGENTAVGYIVISWETPLS